MNDPDTPRLAVYHTHPGEENDTSKEKVSRTLTFSIEDVLEAIQSKHVDYVRTRDAVYILLSCDDSPQMFHSRRAEKQNGMIEKRYVAGMSLDGGGAR